MMKLAQKLNHHRINVTVATLEFIHQKIIITQEKNREQQIHGGIKLVSLGGSIGSDPDLSDPVILIETMEKALPIQLRELLLSQQEEQFSWVIADAFLPGAFEVTKEFGILAPATVVTTTGPRPRFNQSSPIIANFRKGLLNKSTIMNAICENRTVSSN
ncbi:hypothetical protein LINPERPRIM_LOCUS22418 [Linum perenne]